MVPAAVVVVVVVVVVVAAAEVGVVGSSLASRSGGSAVSEVWVALVVAAVKQYATQEVKNISI